MAKKPTDKQLFKMKNEWLEQFYEEVKPRDFYRAVFPEGSFEREGHPEDEKCNGVLTVIEGEKARSGGAWAKPSKAFPLNYPRAIKETLYG